MKKQPNARTDNCKNQITHKDTNTGRKKHLRNGIDKLEKGKTNSKENKQIR